MYINKFNSLVVFIFLLTALACNSSINENSLDINGTSKVAVTMSSARLFENTKCAKLASAIIAEDIPLVHSIISKDTSILNSFENKFGVTILYWAIYNGLYSASEALLEEGADPNIVTPDNGAPICVAAGHPKSSEFLLLCLKYGGDPNISTEDAPLNETPLIAASMTNLKNVKLLINAGANVNYVTKNGNFALKSALELDQLEIVHYLIVNCNANFNLPVEVTPEGDTLHVISKIWEMDFKKNSTSDILKKKIETYITSNNSH